MWGMNNKPAGDHNLETQSHPIDMNISKKNQKFAQCGLSDSTIPSTTPTRPRILALFQTSQIRYHIMLIHYSNMV
jgi:hypothetical protein